LAAIYFASRLQDDGSLTIPKEVAAALGLHPGDEVQLRVDTPDERLDQADYDLLAAELLAEARSVRPEPGKPLTDPQEAAFGEMIKEKYRKQGFQW
jgi:AbrB family looped-hinge helix DNA binding protein